MSVVSSLFLTELDYWVLRMFNRQFQAHCFDWDHPWLPEGVVCRLHLDDEVRAELVAAVEACGEGTPLDGILAGAEARLMQARFSSEGVVW
jgi:hypothetical protein